MAHSSVRKSVDSRWQWLALDDISAASCTQLIIVPAPVQTGCEAVNVIAVLYGQVR